MTICPVAGPPSRPLRAHPDREPQACRKTAPPPEPPWVKTLLGATSSHSAPARLFPSSTCSKTLRSHTKSDPPVRQTGHVLRYESRGVDVSRRAWGQYRVRRIGVPAWSCILIRCLVVHVRSRRMRTGLGTDRGRVGMLRRVCLVSGIRLIILLFPGLVAAGFGEERLGRGGWRRGDDLSLGRAGWRQG